tara:strand:- start:2119 stop:3855 length:1737 start_codon:yes stop_codon:yes gene_type:complete
MAERYRRYESKGLVTNIPTLSFAAEKAMAQGYSKIGSVIDQMSKIFYNRAESEKKSEGLEYGALNAPTKQQILDAQEHGYDLNLPGDKTTVFGKAARASALEIAENEMTYQAKLNISSIILNAKKNRTDPSEVQLQLDSLIDGFASSIEKDSPATSRKLRAKVGIYANAEYSTYTKSYISNARKEMIAKFELAFQNLKTIEIPKLIENGLPTEDENDYGENIAITRDIIKFSKSNLLSKIPPGTSRSEIEDIANDFDKRVLEVSQNIFYEAIFKSKNPTLLYEKLKNGKIKELPLSMQSAYSVLEGKDKQKLFELAFKAVNDNQQYEESIIENNNKKRDENIRIVEHSISNALLLMIDPITKEKGVEIFKKQINIMKTLDATKAKEMTELMDENLNFKYASVTDSAYKESFESRLIDADTTLTMGMLNTALLKQKLSYPDYLTYKEKLGARLDKDFNEALKFVRSKLNIPLYNNPNIDKNGQMMKKLNAMTEAMIIERRKNPDGFIAKQFVEENFDLIVGNLNIENNKALKKELTDGGYGNLQGLKNKVRSNPKSIIHKILLEKIELWNKENEGNKIN